MDSEKRNFWIVLILLLVILCCCALAVGAAVVSWLVVRSPDIGEFDLGGLNRERIDKIFDAGGAPALEIVNFAGTITVRAGESHQKSFESE